MKLFSLTLLFFILAIFLITAEASQIANNENTNNKTTNNKDNRCAGIDGKCMNKGNCEGLKLGGLCPGASTTVCCLPSYYKKYNITERVFISNTCTAYDGICTQANDLTHGVYVKDLCPGGICFFRYNSSFNKTINIETTNKKTTIVETIIETTSPKPTSIETTSIETTSSKPTNIKTTSIETTSSKPTNIETTSIETTGPKPINIETTSSKPTSIETIGTKITNNKTTNHRTIRYKTTNHKTINYKTTNRKTTNNKISNNRCASIGGKCMNSKSCSNGIIIKGLCSGTINNKCCMKNKTTNKKTIQAKGNKCANVGGTCMNSKNCSNGIKVKGLCQSGNNNICCFKKINNNKIINQRILNNNTVNKNTTNNKNNKCANIGGKCMNSKNCSNGVVINGLCSGTSNNKCCMKSITANKDTSIRAKGNTCANIGGRCINSKSCNNGIKVKGLCPSGNNNICCFANTNKKTENKINTNNKTTNNTISYKVPTSNIMEKNKYSSNTWNCEDHKICASALKQVGRSEWSPDVERKAENNKEVLVQKGQPKCNLFVYEMLLNNGIDIGTPNRGRKYFIIPTPRPPLAEDWFDFKDKINNENSKLKTYFKTIKSKNESKPGDIIVSKDHIGIVSNNYKNKSSNGNNKEKELCISASFTEKKIVNNEWGFTRGGPVKIYRLKDEYLKKVCPNCSA